MNSRTVDFLAHNLAAQLVIISVAGMFIGIILIFLPIRFVIYALGATVLAFAALKRPVMGLTFILVVSSTILNPGIFPRIPIGIGRLLVTDLAIFGLLGIIILRALIEQDFTLIHSKLDLPLLLFYSLGVLSTLIAIFQSTLTINQILGELRILNSFLTFFLVTNLVRNEDQLRSLLHIIFLLATLVAATMVVQYLLGESITILHGRIETLYTEGEYFSGISRIIPPGELILFVAFITITTLLIMTKRRSLNPLVFLQWGLVGTGVLLTFARHYWLAVIMAIVLLLFLVRGKERQRLTRWGIRIAFLCTLVSLITLTKPDTRAATLVNGSIVRLSSLFEQSTYLDQQSSLRQRDIEYEYAIPQILSHPILGLGMGASYRPYIQSLDWGDLGRRRYIHNGHYAIMIKAGGVGYLCLLWVSLLFIWRGLKYWQMVPDVQMRAALLGFTLSYLGILIASVVSPIIYDSNGTPLIGIMMGSNEVIIRKFILENTD